LIYSAGAKPEPFQHIVVTQLTIDGNAQVATISPDGKYVAYVKGEYSPWYVFGSHGKQSLWMRQIAGGDVQVTAPAKVDYIGLTFSRDGEYLYVVKSNEKDTAFRSLYKMPALGGPTKKLVADVDSRVTLSPDGGQLAFIRNSMAMSESALVVAKEDGSGERVLLVRKWPNAVRSVAWSPDGRFIAATFQLNDSGHRYITVEKVLLGDGSVQPLTSKHWDWTGSPIWSSDGRGLFVTALEGGDEQINYISYPDGAVRRITSDVTGYGDGLSLTDDARSMAAIRGQKHYDIWVASLSEAEKARPITSGGLSYSPTWTSDGRVVYTNDSQIWVMDPDGTNARQLTATGGAYYLSPRVPEIGRYIFFSSTLDEIWRMDSDGGNPKQLTERLQLRGDGYIDCTPDGKWVVFARDPPTHGIWKVSVDGGEPVRINAAKAAVSPAISPDGKMLAYSYRDPSITPVNGVVVERLEGSAPGKRFDISSPVLGWASDSRSLVYVSTENGVSNLWSQPIAGGQPKQITHFTSELIDDFSLSRDGKQLLLDRGTVDADVVLIRDAK
jgi:Tol biopolymer transport system component